MSESDKGQLKRCGDRCKRMASYLEATAEAPIDCGTLALEILGVEIELAALRLLFQQNCMGP